jgi:hypothetical protein
MRLLVGGITASFLFVCSVVFGQSNKMDYHPCGTPAFQTDFTRAYENGKVSSFFKADSTIYLPLTVHIVGTDDGAGYFEQIYIYETLCQVNEDFAPANIQFFVHDEIQYLNNTSYYQHDDVLQGADMMFENNVENTINCYIVSDPAGNCGYNLPYAGIAMNTSCMGYGDHTWSHELGHALSVQHPFLGWEGNRYVSGKPAQEILIYNYTYFKDTLIRDTVILDTTYSELVDKSNCEIAADKHCDTPPDFISNRWTCDNDGFSPNVMYDSNGEAFYADGTLIMSYSNDACQSRFTNEEVARMRSNIAQEKMDYLFDQNVPNSISEIEIISPKNAEMVNIDQVECLWNSVEHVEEYIVSVGLGPNLSNRAFYYTKDTFLILDDYTFFEGAPYFFEIYPINSKYFCAPTSRSSFVPTSISSSNELNHENVSIWPTVLQNNETIHIKVNSFKERKCLIYNSNGSIVLEKELLPTKLNRINLPFGLNAGVYYCKIIGASGNTTKKIIVH